MPLISTGGTLLLTPDVACGPLSQIARICSSRFAKNAKADPSRWTVSGRKGPVRSSTCRRSTSALGNSPHSLGQPERPQSVEAV